MTRKSYFILISAVLMLFLSSCNMPTPQQRPGDPTPDINLILTQIAAEHQSEANTATPGETEKYRQKLLDRQPLHKKKKH